jgi:HEAT repeat protein
MRIESGKLRMSAYSRTYGISLCLMLSAFSPSVHAQNAGQAASLLVRFRETTDTAAKENILNQIVQRGHRVGQPLLDLAKGTDDNDTRWLAIRGLGRLKFQEAAPFLVESLRSDERYVRANAARALGELRYSRAAPALLRVLEAEQDDGVIEQVSLALRMVNAKEAIPVLKSRMSFHSAQTRCWLLDAVARLGSKDDVPFIAQYLYGPDASVQIPLCAARALATLTGQDFGLPKASGIFDPQTPVLRAREWWKRTQEQN